MRCFFYFVAMLLLSSCQDEFVMPDYQFVFEISYKQEYADSSTMRMDYTYLLNGMETKGSLTANDPQSISDTLVLKEGDRLDFRAATLLDSSATVRLHYKAFLDGERITSGTKEEIHTLDFRFIN